MLETRESRSRPTQGSVKSRSRGIKPDGGVVIEYTRGVMVWKRDYAPKEQHGSRAGVTVTAEIAEWLTDLHVSAPHGATPARSGGPFALHCEQRGLLGKGRPFADEAKERRERRSSTPIAVGSCAEMRMPRYGFVLR